MAAEYICSSAPRLTLCVVNDLKAKAYLLIPKAEDSKVSIDAQVALVFPGQKGKAVRVAKPPSPLRRKPTEEVYDVTSYLPALIREKIGHTGFSNCHHTTLSLSGFREVEDRALIQPWDMTEYLNRNFMKDWDGCRQKYGAVLVYWRWNSNQQRESIEHSAFHLFGDIVFHKGDSDRNDTGIYFPYEFARSSDAMDRRHHHFQRATRPFASSTVRTRSYKIVCYEKRPPLDQR